VSSIFEHYQELQARPQSQRYQVYHLLNELMSNHRKGVLFSHCMRFGSTERADMHSPA